MSIGAQTWAFINAARGNTDAVIAYLNTGADVNAVDNDGMSALHLAVRWRHAATVNALLNRGAKVSVTDINGWTPLHWAARHGFTDVVNALLVAGDAGAGVNAVNNEGLTPLHLAIQSGHASIVNTLLDRGAEVNGLDKTGMTALHMAACLCFTDIINILLEKGANINPDFNFADDHNFFITILRTLLNAMLKRAPVEDGEKATRVRVTTDNEFEVINSLNKIKIKHGIDLEERLTEAQAELFSIASSVAKVSLLTMFLNALDLSGENLEVDSGVSRSSNFETPPLLRFESAKIEQVVPNGKTEDLGIEPQMRIIFE